MLNLLQNFEHFEIVKYDQLWRGALPAVRRHGQAAYVPHQLCTAAGRAEVSVRNIQVLSFVVK